MPSKHIFEYKYKYKYLNVSILHHEVLLIDTNLHHFKVINRHKKPEDLTHFHEGKDCQQ